MTRNMLDQTAIRRPESLVKQPTDREVLLHSLWRAGSLASSFTNLLVTTVITLRSMRGVASCGVWKLEQGEWQFLRGSGDLGDETVVTALHELSADVELPEQPAHQIRTLIDMWRRGQSPSSAALTDHFPCRAVNLELSSTQRAVLVFWGPVANSTEPEEFPQWLTTIWHEVAEVWSSGSAHRGASAAFRAIAGSDAVGLIGFNCAGHVTRWTDGAQQLLGWPASATLGQPCQFLPRPDVLDLLQHIRSCACQLKSFTLQRQGRHWNGTTVWLELTFLPITRGHDAEALVLIAERTAQQRKQSQAEALTSLIAELAVIPEASQQEITLLARMAAAANCVSAACWEIRDDEWKPRCCWNLAEDQPHASADCQVLLATVRRAAAGSEILWPQESLQLRELLGWTATQDCGRDCIAIPVPGQKQILLLRGATTISSQPDLHKSLQACAALWALQFRHNEAAAALRDSESQLRQLRNMDAIGMFSGGIAHDFNNLLAIILGNCEMLELQLGAGESQSILQEVRAAGERATALTRRLLGFSRKRETNAELLDVNQRVRGMEDMLARMLGPDIELTIDLQESLSRVLLDPVECEQLLLNLTANARDAMPQGGRLNVATRNVTLDLRAVAGHPDVRPGEFVSLSVTDSGHGMDAETLAQLFKPFFTTKGEGLGTGLGLSVVTRITRAARGLILVHSQPGQGSTFTVHLPRARVGLAPRFVDRPVNPCPAGNETILVVDDEPAIRALTASILQAKGYRVIEAENANAALRIMNSSQPPHLLLTDVMMPGMNGVQLACVLRKSLPQLPVLLMSGSVDRNEVAEADLAGQSLLSKPFTSDALLREVRAQLDQ